MQFYNLLLLIGQAILYFTVMVCLLQSRHRIGLGVFLCALGVMHFLETYLASVFYIALPFGVISPGSTVLFSGKLMMILLLYIKEDAAIVRQPIYGLLVGNFLLVGLVMILRNHQTLPLIDGKVPDIAFIDEIGWLMIWGTTLLFVDSIGIILLYERIGSWFRAFPALRILICAMAVLTFDQLGFYVALRVISGAPIEVLYGGWMAKMGAAAVYTVLFVIFLRLTRHHEARSVVSLGVGDIFHVLTYRERYEQLLEAAGRDHLTGAYGRSRYDAEGPRIIEAAVRRGQPLSMLVIDIDNFKLINDSLGHTAGDRILKKVSDVLMANLRSDDHLFRYGGEEFVVICERLPKEAAHSMADRLRRTISDAILKDEGSEVTVSVGISAAPADGRSLLQLFEHADRRLYSAKQSGRDRVCADDAAYASAPA
ncbi:GGDEF domain-containing protein [Stappia sp. F7233]|uniref:diguanylate cyclase n=1 Tax=Stappia albiluteola TaxID=2758565 RepID=A0A839AJP3_9HYPH|nr:GGDEF domain-containing protein [Stappia albiluteola]MBA5778987.1 GGDEF domain-containing protein [Stappia albiluteola]